VSTDTGSLAIIGVYSMVTLRPVDAFLPIKADGLDYQQVGPQNGGPLTQFSNGSYKKKNGKRGKRKIMAAVRVRFIVDPHIFRADPVKIQILDSQKLYEKNIKLYRYRSHSVRKFLDTLE